uniref:Uncharacterized protein n=1 Tax=Physcomitrium patens TaxID=3218 RepID=A0A2K1IWV9_PHYPA|nr:hypothetical protein PHYPA_023579 [Physcomitrium patens]
MTERRGPELVFCSSMDNVEYFWSRTKPYTAYVALCELRSETLMALRVAATNTCPSTSGSFFLVFLRCGVGDSTI